MSMDLAVKEVAWAKEHGACAIFLRGGEGGKLLSDPHFHPLYRKALELDLPICIHAGNGSFALDDLYRADSATFARAKLSALAAIHEIIVSQLPMKFPGLRFGAIEISASWVPHVCHDLAARMKRLYDREMNPFTILQENRIYVACQTDDDLPYVLKYAGEDRLVIGSDYGHADTASELEALRNLKQSGSIPVPVIDKILDDNARALYGLS
jgi:predicted TIM-barrel fold metal-dependent hydrolase